MFMTIIWIASLWVLAHSCVPIVFFIRKACIQTLMTIRMVSVTLICISVPSFFLSHSGGDASIYNYLRIYMSYVCRTNMFSYFLPLRLCRHGLFYYWFYYWFVLRPSQDPADCHSFPRGSSSEHHRHHPLSPNKFEGVHLWLLFLRSFWHTGLQRHRSHIRFVVACNETTYLLFEFSWLPCLTRKLSTLPLIRCAWGALALLSESMWYQVLLSLS